MLRSLFAVVVVASLAGCSGMNLGRLKGANGTSAAAKKKDCAACEKMCSVAADTEKNPNAVTQCKADCKKSCE